MIPLLFPTLYDRTIDSCSSTKCNNEQTGIHVHTRHNEHPVSALHFPYNVLEHGRHPVATTCQDSLAGTSSTGGSEEESRSDESGSDSDEDYSSADDENDSTDTSRGSGEETEEDHEVGRSILPPLLAVGAPRPPAGSGCEASILTHCRGGWNDGSMMRGGQNNSIETALCRQP